MSLTIQTSLAVTLPFDGPDRSAVIGGKAAGIDRLLRAGFDVPPTAVLTAASYRRFLSDDRLRRFVEDIRAGRCDPSAEEVDEAFTSTPVPDELRAAVQDAVSMLGAAGPIALRSSATVEDMQGFSFAGQYRSFLGIDSGDSDAVLHALRSVWASLWHPAPRAYRQAWGFREDTAAMAVLLMKMIPARSAGVAFSVDPGGTVGTIRVEGVSGLGDDLVSGRRTPEVWLVPRAAQAAAQELTPEPAATVATLALRVEEALGGPQDVEWAWDGERVWLVQARPITAIDGDGCDTPVDDAELSPVGVEEMLPGALAPLIWDTASFCVEEGFRGLLADVGVTLPDATGPHAVLRRVRGRAALDLDLLKAAAATLPGVGAADVEEGYFGTDNAEGARRRRHSPRHDLRLLAARRRALAEGDTVLVTVADLMNDHPNLPDLDDAALAAYRFRLLDLGARATAAEIAVAAVAAAAYRGLEALLARHLPAAEAAGCAQRLTVGSGVVGPTSPDSSMAVFGGPTWRETGAELPAHRSTNLVSAVEAAQSELEGRLTSSPGWRRTRILTGQFVDIRIHSLRRAAIEARDRLGERDCVKAAVLAIGGLVRDTHLEIGRRLTARGLLPRPADVDLLRDLELRASLRTGIVPAPAQLAARARHLARHADAPPLPARFVGVPSAAGETHDVAGDVLTGWAASPGRYTGRARVLDKPDRSVMTEGDVVVARATDSAWTPVFLLAGAIVVERGGPLSHAALVARELGIPAVLNVANATELLAGREVTVDGDRGELVVHKGTERSDGASS